MPSCRTITRRHLLFATGAASIALGFGAAPAWAVTLDQAKAQGLVGERPDGYIGPVNQPVTQEIAALIAQVNAGRHQAHEDVARRNGTPIANVEALAGQKLVSRAGPGEFVMQPGGQWVKR